MATPSVPTAILAAATPEKNDDRSGFGRFGGEVLREHNRSDDLGVERQPDGVPVQVAEAAASTRRRRGHYVVDGPETIGQGGDGSFVGEVDEVGGDVWLVPVRGGQGGLTAPGDDDARPGIADREGNGSGDAAGPAYDEHSLTAEIGNRAALQPTRGRTRQTPWGETTPKRDGLGSWSGI
jgi:hypothetical protein